MSDIDEHSSSGSPLLHRGRNKSPTNKMEPEKLATSYSSSSRSSSVRFNVVEFRYYHTRIGDHPDCIKGPPISFGWQYLDNKIDISDTNDNIDTQLVNSIPIDEYEKERAPQRRHKNKLRLSPYERLEILKNNGYPRSACDIAQWKARVCRKEREQTLKKLQYFSRVRDVMRNVRNNLFGIVSCVREASCFTAIFFVKRRKLLTANKTHPNPKDYYF